MHKDAREIQLMLGEKIDEAQGRGDIRLTVLRIPEESARPLPVERKELWVGIGGDQSVGVQEFDVELSGGGSITLETHPFDDNIHGDGAIWMDVSIEGGYGSKKLLEISPEAIQAGYGRHTLETEKPVEVAGKPYQHLQSKIKNPLRHYAIPGFLALHQPCEIEARDAASAFRAAFVKQIDPAFRGRAGTPGFERRVGEVSREHLAADGPCLAAVEARPDVTVFPALITDDVAENEDIAAEYGEARKAAH